MIPQYASGVGTSLVFKAAAALGRDSVFYQDPTYSYRYDAWVASARAELEHKPHPDWSHVVGVETASSAPVTTFTLPEFNRAAVSQGTGSYASHQVAPYLRVVWHREGSPWTLSPALRTDYTSLTQEFWIQPRLGVRYAFSPFTELHAAAGFYTQSPADHLLDPSYGNSGLKAERSWHATLGADADLRGGGSRGIRISGDIFAKVMENLVALSSSSGEHFNNTGFGRSYGVELLVRVDYGDLKAWLGYTISRSTRFSSRFADHAYGYNQTHALSALGSYLLPRNWRISGRVRVLSRPPGSPLIEGAVSGIYLPKPGAFMSTELIPSPPLFQADLRFDKSWIYDRWILSFFVDFSNLTFSPSADGLGLPVVPVLGAKAEF